MNHESEFI
uniref:Uncharacterized protein n=1 Tax=Arundo donax TaxID=35708 RepID=A0A0A9A5U6_ARUDO